MIIFDAHCDTITKIMEQNESLLQNNCHNDLVRMKEYGKFAQMFAAFIDPVYCHAYAMKRAIQIIDKLYQQIEIYNNEVMLCSNYNDIQKAFDKNSVAAILSIEGGDALQGEISALRMFYKLGVRSICLTWNHRNEIADGVGDSHSKGGLTEFGREVVKEMNNLGMLIDVSHISEAGFWDVIDESKSPVIASHSNSKVICKHRRNLTDKQITAIKEKKGVIGVNLYPNFLSDNVESSLKEIINHIEHIASIAGTKCIGLGADFDGIACTPNDINGVHDIYKIFVELQRLNYSNDFIENFAGGNFLRVFKEICG